MVPGSMELEAQSIRRSGANRVGAKKFESGLYTGRIPGTIFGRVVKGGSVLSKFLNR